MFIIICTEHTGHRFIHHEDDGQQLFNRDAAHAVRERLRAEYPDITLRICTVELYS